MPPKTNNLDIVGGCCRIRVPQEVVLVKNPGLMISVFGLFDPHFQIVVHVIVSGDESIF